MSAGLSVLLKKPEEQAHVPSPLRQSSLQSTDASSTSAEPRNEVDMSVSGADIPNPGSADAATGNDPTHLMLSSHLPSVHRAWTPDSSPGTSFDDTAAAGTTEPISFNRFAKGRLASLKASPVHLNSLTMANSWEEVPQGSFDIASYENFEALDVQLEIDLKEQMDWRIEHCAEDGNCLFRALADQLIGGQEGHMEIRQKTMDYMVANKDAFLPFIIDSESFEHYIARKRKPFTFANDLEISAAASALRRKIELYRYSPIPFLTYLPEPDLGPNEDHEPLRISYQRRCVDRATRVWGVSY
jgi:hypothetical protein